MTFGQWLTYKVKVNEQSKSTVSNSATVRVILVESRFQGLFWFRSWIYATILLMSSNDVSLTCSRACVATVVV